MTGTIGLVILVNHGRIWHFVRLFSFNTLGNRSLLRADKIQRQHRNFSELINDFVAGATSLRGIFRLSTVRCNLPIASDLVASHLLLQIFLHPRNKPALNVPRTCLGFCRCLRYLKWRNFSLFPPLCIAGTWVVSPGRFLVALARMTRKGFA